MKAGHRQMKANIGNQVVDLKPGEFVTGRKKAAQELGMSESKVYRLLDSLRRTQNLHIKSNNKFSVISIINWSHYQGDNLESEQQSEQQMNNKRTASEHKQECKELKKKENAPRSKNSNGGSRRSVTPDPTFEELLSRYSEPEQASIRECFKALAITRKSGKISDSVLLAQLKYWSAFEQWKVIGGIEVYLQKETHLTGRGEDYLRGIIRKFIPGELKRHSRPADPPVITTEEMYSRLKVL